jgi:hypothetical protein
MKPFFLLLSFVLLASSGQAQLLSPDQFLPHKWGEHFTPHEMQVSYYQQVAANSKNIILRPYGYTNQKRPLQLAFISSEANLAKLEAIRQNNLRRAGLLEGATDPSLDNLSIIWLSYSVHGNEAAGAESCLRVVYELVNPQNASTKEWLKNTLIIIDPCINPDGNSRYTHWYRNVVGTSPNTSPNAREHQEPWPGGRVNHYNFDLNRDWAWQTQIETRQRLLQYNQWMPQVHVDVHEQGPNSPYYFAPAAQPYHRYITQWQRDFQVQIGKNNAKYFDQEGWLYFTKEVFDLFYPSYGDTYPMYNGAIGMTYEQGGIGAGLAMSLRNGDTLTLKDRVMHHYTASLSTIEMASKNATQLNKNFADFFQRARTNPPGQYKSFVIKANTPRERLKTFCELLDRNQIQYGKAGKTSSLNAYDYQTGKSVTLKVEPNDLVVSAYQTRGTLAQILLEPTAELVDSLTYDITAWALPYAHGLEAYASTQRLDPDGAFTPSPVAITSNAKAYAYLAPWRSSTNVKFLAAILKKGVKVRYAQAPFSVEGKTYARGTLLITEGDNRKMSPAYRQVVEAAARQFEQELSTVNTGFADSGSDFGSGNYSFIQRPEVAILSGDQTSNNEFGQVWYYFDQELQYPHTVLDANRLERLDLSTYNTLIMPEGRYRLSDAVLEKIGNWVNAGGRLIAIGDAVPSLQDRKGFSLTRYANEDDKKKADKAADEATLAARFLDYASEERRAQSASIPGAIFKVKIDHTHPLGFGLTDTYFSLKTSDLAYQPLKSAYNVGTIGGQLMVSGFAGAKAKEKQKNTVVFAQEQKGAGSVVYLIDNPLFRAFWENGKLVMGNAVFLR